MMWGCFSVVVEMGMSSSIEKNRKRCSPGFTKPWRKQKTPRIAGRSCFGMA